MQIEELNQNFDPDRIILMIKKVFEDESDDGKGGRIKLAGRLTLFNLLLTLYAKMVNVGERVKPIAEFADTLMFRITHH